MKKDPQIIRLNKFISINKTISRRKADLIIQDNQITVNNQQIQNPGIQINLKTDTIKINGRIVHHSTQKKIYIAFNKPKKVLTTMDDPQSRLCISDFFKKRKYPIFPVGRLDWLSEGLLLLTNDGDFSMRVAHPKYKLPKTYIVKLDGRPTEKHINKLTKGITTKVGKTKALHVSIMKKSLSKHSWVKIIIAQGKNRQLHHMFENLGFRIRVLRRLCIGNLSIKSLKPGEFIILSENDIKKIFLLPSELRKQKRGS